MKVVVGSTPELILREGDLVELGLKAGDQLALERSADGSLRLRPSKPVHDDGLEIARRVMDEYHDTFVALAKS